MENVLPLFPHLNITPSTAEPNFKTFNAIAKERTKKDSKNRPKDKRNRLSLLLRKSESHENIFSDTSENLTCISSVSPEEAVKWGESFDKLLSHKDGLNAFKKFLEIEFSDENIEFWLACEDYKGCETTQQLEKKSKMLYEKYIQKESAREVNLDFATKEITRKNIHHPTLLSFDQAQYTIYNLMEKDSYPRFLKSDIYSDFLKGKQFHASFPALRRRSRSFTTSDFQNVNSDYGIWL
ncbi:regulator of G-protein signaling 18 isoform X1 [Ascaphus truei]|uniref:regulator of G-protein signaling 18 isoform X1 n=1 Tax=Ascaphus truei TaxID=8439 RepID=UPI003F5A2708